MTDDLDRVVARERDHRRARRWHHARRHLRLHAWVFAAVNAGLVVAWAAQGLAFGHAHPLWFLPTTAGWGAGLAVHALGISRLRRRPTSAPTQPA